MNAVRNSRMTTHADLNRGHRQRSGSQTNLSEMTDRRQTYGALRRSVSNSNLRTPRTTLATRSPGNRTPSNVNGLTSNTEQNRRMAPENTAKVLEIIQSSRSFSSRLNLGNGGLKTMTLNQFIDISSFLMVKIGGKNVIAKIRNNHETVILNFLQSLNYPYAVNKSVLKTPNAHHSFPEVIAILAFLCDLVTDIKKFAVPTEMPLIHCDQLINDEFTELFSAEVMKNYLNYEREELLDEAGEMNLVNRLISIRMNRNGLTANELAAKTDDLKMSNKELQQNLVESECEKYFNTIVEQFADKQNEYERLQDVLGEKRKYLKMVLMTYDEKARQLAVKQAQFQDMLHQIHNQKYCVIDVKQLMAEEVSIKNSIVMIRNEKETIEAEAADAQVKLARLQKIKMEDIKKFNNFTYKVTKILMHCQSFSTINVSDLIIDPCDPASNIERVCLRLDQLNENCATIKREFIEQIDHLKVKIADYQLQFDRLSEKYDEQTLKFQNANQQLDAISRKFTQYESKGSTNTNKLQRQIDEKISAKERIDNEVVSLRKSVKELEIRNIQLFEEGERKARDIIRAKQALANQIDHYSTLIDEYTEHV